MAKVKISRVPMPAKGVPDVKVKKTIQPVGREDANLEVEKGEFIVTSGNPMDGYPETYVAGGKNHSEGGTPLSLGDKSFVFTKNPKQKITDEDILKDFSITGKVARKGEVPAEIAKKYNVNDFRKILADPNADKLQKDTADRMIRNYSSKLGELALIQEVEKGLPDGIPFISTVFMDEYGITPESLIHGKPSPTSVASFTEGPVAKEGGQHTVRVLKRPSKIQLLGFSPGGQSGDVEIDPFKAKTKAGSTTSTNQDSNAPEGWTKEVFDKHYASLGIDPTTLTDAQAQSALYDKADPFMKAFMWGKFGRTGKDNKDPLSQFAPEETEYEDFDAYKQRMLQKFGSVDKLKSELDPLKKDFADNKSGHRTAFLLKQFGLSDTPPAAKPATSKPILRTTGEPFTAAQEHVDPPAPEAKAKFWTQDLMKMSGAGYEALKIKKYMPWEAGWETLIPDAVFYDPTRELAANSEAAGMAEMSLNTFRGPQANSSRLSEIMGQSLSNAANILGKYSNMNVQVANQFEQANAAALNADSQARAQRSTRLYDKSVIANQQYDNAKRAARENIRSTMENAITNRGRTQALNTMNKQYNVDPSTGFVNFTGKAGEYKQKSADVDAMFKTINTDYPHLSDQMKMKMLELKVKGFDPTSDGYDVSPDEYYAKKPM
jgi:hypothetical protein